MASNHNVMTLAGRLATFEGAVQITKRRASTAKKTKAATTAEWPHQSPSPEQLARAGFYYKPSSASNDSVTCFMCNKSLDGWDPEDNPALEHLNHVPHCGWAININIEQGNQDPNRMEEDPLSEKMMAARRATFKDAWPHDGKKGWKCKLEKMVAAGWCFTPIPEADDCVQCFYCDVSLDGWEPKDDPWVEHHKRAPECHFFTLIDDAAKIAKLSKGRKGRTSRASKASRLSTQSSLTGVSDVGSIADLDDLPAEEGDTIMSTTSTMSKTGAAKSRNKKVPVKSTRKTTRRAKDDSVLGAADPITPDEQPQLDYQGTDAEQVVHSAKPKSTRGRTAKKKEEESQVQEQSQVQEVIKAKRGKKRGSDGVEKLEISFMPEELMPAPRPTRSRKVDAEASQIESSRLEVVEKAIPVMNRGRPVKKHAPTQVESSILAIDNSHMQSTIASPGFTSLPKSKGGRAAAKAKERVKETTTDEEIMEPEPTFTVQPPQTAAPATTPVASPVPDHTAVVRAAPKSPSAQPSDKENNDSGSSPFPESDHEATPKLSKVTTPTIKNTPRPTHTTPPVSPSRTTTTALTTAQPWTAIDLTTIFLQSPAKQKALSNQAMLQDVVSHLSSEERNMSIEAWIIHHATKAEDRLRGECERLIGVFEENGAKAVRSLGSVVV